MSVRISGNWDFTGCEECELDFNDLIEILDYYHGDYIDEELKDWGYIFTHDSPVKVTLPCDGSVELEWNLGIGDIINAGCI